MSTLQETYSSIRTAVESFDEARQTDWWKAAQAADKQQLWQKDKVSILEAISTDVLADIGDCINDELDDSDEEVDLEEARERIESSDEWTLYGLGREADFDFRIWSLDMFDGHTAFILLESGEKSRVGPVDTN